MNKNILIMLSASFIFFCLISCDGGNGEKEEKFTVYDVEIRVNDVQGITSDCPETAYLKLSLALNGSDISGFAELFGFGKIGEAQSVNGEVVDDIFSIEPFGLGVTIKAPPDSPFPGSSLTLDFLDFNGVFINIVENGSMSGMEGTVSGEIFENTGDVVVCDGEFTGEFTGEAKSPEGCLSYVEFVLDENRACPAEAISDMCDNFYRLCPVPVPSPAPFPTPPPGDFLINNSCKASGCFTVTGCSTAPILTNLEINADGNISGNIFSPEGEHFTCF